MTGNRERTKKKRRWGGRGEGGGGGGKTEGILHTIWPAEQSEKGDKSNDLKAEKQLFPKPLSVQFCEFRQKQSRKT